MKDNTLQVVASQCVNLYSRYAGRDDDYAIGIKTAVNEVLASLGCHVIFRQFSVSVQSPLGRDIATVRA